MARQILLFGAGKSATSLIDYLLAKSSSEDLHLTVVDADKSALLQKLQNHRASTGISIDIHDSRRTELIAQSDIVISLLPPALHLLVARDCLKHRKNLLTASYISPEIRELANDIEAAGLLFLCELGLDPGIDHMSAKKLIDEIKANGGSIHSFYSHCGGLVAPESDDNPWHYKISWNPANIVNAGKQGAVYLENGAQVSLSYENIFSVKRPVNVKGADLLAWYPNRDSLAYIDTYGLSGIQTFIRTTLRHPDFIYGWKNLVELGLTRDDVRFKTDGLSLRDFFKQHLAQSGFSEWLEERLKSQFESTKGLLTELVNLAELELEAEKKGIQKQEEFMVVDHKGDLQQVDIDDLKISAASSLAERMHEASLTLKQLFYLGMDEDSVLLPSGEFTLVEILQWLLERKLALQPGDKDRVVMLHEIFYTIEGKQMLARSSFILDGNDHVHTAMAKTVGLPLGIGALLILNGEIKEKGLHIPVSPKFYNPILSKLEQSGIRFNEEVSEIL